MDVSQIRTDKTGASQSPQGGRSYRGHCLEPISDPSCCQPKTQATWQDTRPSLSIAFFSPSPKFFIIPYFAFCSLTLQIFLVVSTSYRTIFFILWANSFCLSSFVVNLTYLSRHKSFVISSKKACSKWDILADRTIWDSPLSGRMIIIL